MAEYKADNPSRPFCSERCKLIDLGAWAEERYSIPGVAQLGDSSELVHDADIDKPVDDSLLAKAPNRHLNS
jgi:endogenous inhibitor of DNA gyrase (YacG/DUF329 family)